jgi:CRP/FNR family nitrogen fixation transcriptional regulator
VKDNITHLFGAHGSIRRTPSALGGWEAGDSPSKRQEIGSASIGTSRTVAKDQKVFAEGEAADFFYRVVSGVVRTYMIFEDGRRQIDGFHLAGDIFGLEAGARHRFSANSIGDATVIAFRRSDLDGLLVRNTAIAKQVQSSLILNLERAQSHLLLLGRKTAQEKIAGFLLDLAQRASKSKTSNLPLRHSDIADYLGLSRETVSRALTRLSSDEIIEIKGPPISRSSW